MSGNSRTNGSNVRDTPNLQTFEQVSRNDDDYNNSMDDYFPNGNGRTHQNKLKKSNKDNKNSQSTDT